MQQHDVRLWVTKWGPMNTFYPVRRQRTNIIRFVNKCVIILYEM